MGFWDLFRKKEDSVPTTEIDRLIDDAVDRAINTDPIWTRGHYSGMQSSFSQDAKQSRFVEYQRLYGEGGDALLHACVFAIASDVSRVVLKPYIQSTRTVAPRMPSLALEMPNERQTLPNLVEEIVIDALLNGNAFIALDTSGELFRLPPERMKIYTDSKGHVDHYTLVGEGESESVIEKDRVVHLSLPDPNQSLWGVGPAQASRATLVISDGEAKYLQTFYKNGARPSGFVSFDATVDPDEARRAFKEFKSKYARPDAHGEIVAFVGGAKYEAMSSTPVEGGVIETRRLTQDTLQAVFGIPAFRLMDLDDADYANSKAQERIYDLKTVIPWAWRVTDALNKNKLLVPSPTVVKLEPDEQPILNMHRDEASIATATATYVDSGVMSRDQVRARFLGVGPIDDPSVPQYGPITPAAVDNAVEDTRAAEVTLPLEVVSEALIAPKRDTKLSHEQAEEIRALYALGTLNQTQIALHYSVAQRTVSKIIRKELYRKK